MTTPMLTTAPGLSVRAMQQSSNVDVRWPPSSASHGYIQPHGEHRVMLAIANELVHLPPGRFSIVETRYGVAARLHCTPQLDHLPLRQALALSRDLKARLVERGFRIEGAPDAEVIERCLVGPRGDARVCALTAPHGSASWRAEVCIRRLVEAGSALAKMLAISNDAFIVTLILWDPPLLQGAP